MSLSKMGASERHGPHHGAQKSTTTGTSWDFWTTMVSKSFSPTEKIHDEFMACWLPRVRCRDILYFIK
jgi:hypothetical protein